METTTKTNYTSETRLVLSAMHALAACEDCGFGVEEFSNTKSTFLNLFESAPHYSKFYPKLLGSEANNLNAMIAIFKLAAGRNSRMAFLSMAKPSDPTPPRRDPFNHHSTWGAKELEPLAKDLCAQTLGSKEVRVIDMAGGTSVVEASFGDAHLVVYSNVGRSKVRHSFGVNSVAFVLDAIGKAHGRTVKLSII